MNENEIIEEWLPIEGYEGLYEVSNFGRVKSLKFGKEKILRQGKKSNGYLGVILYKEGKIKNLKVHRLVAKAFLDNPNNYPCVNHKDEDKTNNCVDNLEWCTYQYNSNYGSGISRKVANTDYKARTAKIDYKAIGRKNAEKQSKKVYQYTLDGTLVAIWKSTRECGRNGFDQRTVSACCNGKLKTHKGYIWSYIPL